MSSLRLCPSTFSAGQRLVIACELPAGHDGRHSGNRGDWLWRHGNGETCRTCAHLTTGELEDAT